MIMIMSNESNDYSQNGYIYQRTKEMNQSVGVGQFFFEMLKTNLLLTRVLLSNTKKWVVSVNLLGGANFYISMDLTKSLKVTVLTTLSSKLNSANSIFN